MTFEATERKVYSDVAATVRGTLRRNAERISRKDTSFHHFCLVVGNKFP